MLRRSHTATIEKNETYFADFETEPYECGWAREATWFIRVIEMTDGTTLKAMPQVSPDGLFWCDKEGERELSISERGLRSREVRNFASWLRLRCELEGDNPRVKVIIHLALKE